MMFDWNNKTVIVTGGSGFLGSHLCDLLMKKGCMPFVPRKFKYDLRSKEGTRDMFCEAGVMRGKVDILFNLAANVGGIGYNQQHPYRLFLDNIKIGLNVIDEAMRHGVKKLVQVGTVCSYPKWTRAPFQEEQIWDGYPEETNAPYGLAKKMLLVQMQAARREYGFPGIYLLPTNLYGPRDNFDPEQSHVIPALIRKCIEAQTENKDIEAWGSGNATRDFLYVLDAAEAIILAAEKYDNPDPLNIGSGREIKISDLLRLITEILQFSGKVKWNRNKPDGQPQRVLDIFNVKDCLQWKPRTSLQDGLIETIRWYKYSEKTGKRYNEKSLREPVLT